MSAGKGPLSWITEYSLPLIVGVFAALAAANIDHEWYHHFVHAPLTDWKILGHEINVHFLVDDIFMVFFFGVAAKEIVDALLPGGALSPMSNAVNPLLGTLGGVLGPAGVFFGLSWYFYGGDAAAAGDGARSFGTVAHGWGIPTATDIALAWLVARLVFGARHPAVSFLLLLAIADDAIGLGIIAVFYPDPHNPVQPLMLLWTLAGMVAAFGLRKADVRNWWLYVVLAGGLAWYGLLQAHLHPALALVFIVPFMPKTLPAAGLIPEAERGKVRAPPKPSTIDNFENTLKGPVDWGLFVFAFSKAGVTFDVIGVVTWMVLAALIVGKMVGISLFSGLGVLLGFPLPAGMNVRCLVVASLVAGLGLTVALFVCGVAYVDPVLQGEAKMGALFSGSVFVLAIVLARLLGIRPTKH